MGPMRDGINKLPKDHWIHKAVAKEKKRLVKKTTGPNKAAAIAAMPPQPVDSLDTKGC